MRRCSMAPMVLAVAFVTALLFFAVHAALAPSPGAEPSRQAPAAGAPVILPGLLIPVADGCIACTGRLPDDLTCWRVIEPAFRCVADFPRLHCNSVKDPFRESPEQEGTER